MSMVKSELGCLAPDLGSRIGAFFTEREGGVPSDGEGHSFLDGDVVGQVVVGSLECDVGADGVLDTEPVLDGDRSVVVNLDVSDGSGGVDECGSGSDVDGTVSG